MEWLTLPEPRRDATLAFQDPASAKTWLANQPQAHPMAMLLAITGQIDAIRATPLSPATAVSLLNLLRSAAIPGQTAIEPRYSRKPLPLGDEDEHCFDIAQGLWLRLGIAYLGLAPYFSPPEKALPLQRAACAFRMAQYCYFLAARSCPACIDRLLFGVLAEAENSGTLRTILPDPDFRHLGETHVSGHLAWAFMLRLIDPYRFSAAQLAVANRALSRWRELTAFQTIPDDDPRAHSIDLSPLFDGPYPADLPRWMEVRKVERKIAGRIAALQGGEEPENLKLGRELSAAACIRLFRDIESGLEYHAQTATTEIGEIELTFGSENAYAVLTGEQLRSQTRLDSTSATLAHRRVAMFGFDRVSVMPTTVKKLNVPSEKWTLVDGMAVRAAGTATERRLAPCLIASRAHEKTRLGVLYGLRTNADGALNADLRWYPEPIEAGRLQLKSSARGRNQAIFPAFLMHDGERYSLVAPPNAGVRLAQELSFQADSVYQLMPDEVLERGVDFVRYAVTWLR